MKIMDKEQMRCYKLQLFRAIKQLEGPRLSSASCIVVRVKRKSYNGVPLESLTYR